MKAKTYPLGKKALVSLFCLLATVLLCEIILRVVGYRYTPFALEIADKTNDWRGYHAFSDHNFVYDPYLLWRPDPASPAFSPLGFVGGTELPKNKGPNDLRLFVFGDSNSAGWYDDSIGKLRDTAWPMRLGKLLSGGDKRCTVVNASVWGYSSFQGLARLKKCLGFRPDMVLVSFGANDAHRVTVPDTRFTPRLFQWPAFRTRIGQLMVAAWHRLPAGAGDIKAEDLVPRVSVPEYRDNLAEIIRICRQYDIQCVLLTRPFVGESPSALWWKNFAPDYVAATIEVGKNSNVPVVDLYAAFKDKNEYFRDECHFTDEGHEIAAKIVSDKIRSLLTATPGTQN